MSDERMAAIETAVNRLMDATRESMAAFYLDVNNEAAQTSARREQR